VALGDSYTAAPYVPLTALAHGCLRSSGSYPRLVAKRLDLHLRDVSCGGANTDDITHRQDAPSGASQPPQIDAVRPDARLVTVGIGGNDDHVFGTLVDRCLRWSQSPSVDAFPGAGSCAARVDDALGNLDAVIARISGRVTRVMRLVHRRAPRALVVLVGYPRLVAQERTCESMPLVTSDRLFVARLESRVRAALASAARRSGARFADMYRLSRGHEICSDDPWVNGETTDRERALAFHPFAVEQRAVAAAVAHLVRRRL